MAASIAAKSQTAQLSSLSGGSKVVAARDVAAAAGSKAKGPLRNWYVRTWGTHHKSSVDSWENHKAFGGNKDSSMHFYGVAIIVT